MKVKNVLVSLWEFLKYPVIVVGILVAVFCLMVGVFLIDGYLDGRRLRKGQRKRVRASSLVKQIYYEVPKMYVDDLYSRDPDFFKYQGLVLYTGMQGYGKTVAMIHDIYMMQQEFPRCKCITNVAYAYEDDALRHWRQLIDYKNGIYGVIVGLDEIQNWFSSKQSKDFPPEMFEVVTQNRKNRRIILATSQHFYQPAKDIRMQCTEVRKCRTILGCFTIIHAVRPVFDSDGDVKQWKHVSFRTFAHTKEIREAYDTYKVIESLTKSGFLPRESR